MSDFWKSLIGTVVGGAIALAGTIYSTSRAESKETRAEQRNKLEALMAGAVRSDRCFQIYVLNREEPKDCDEQEPLWKAITIAELHFQELNKELAEFQEVLLAGKAELEGCRQLLKSANPKDRDRWDECAVKVYERHDTSTKLEAIFEKAKPIMARLYEGSPPNPALQRTASGGR